MTMLVWVVLAYLWWWSASELLVRSWLREFGEVTRGQRRVMRGVAVLGPLFAGFLLLLDHVVQDDEIVERRR